MADEYRTPGGSKIYRHTDDEAKPFHIPEEEGAHLHQIETFLSGFLGPQSGVLHEIISDQVHLDVLVFGPTRERQNWTFVTSGVSDRPMNVPEGLEPRADYQFAELAITLPVDWFKGDENGMIADAEFAAPGKYWPIGLLKFLGRLPHEYDSWIWLTHTFVSDETAPAPYDPSTRMSGAILLPPVSWPEDKHILKTREGNVINFFAVFPLHADEMTLKLNKGEEALVEALERAGVTDLLDPSRPSSVSRRSFLDFLKR